MGARPPYPRRRHPRAPPQPAGHPLDPIGIRVRGAVVEGRLNIDSISATHPLALDHCYLPHGLSARGTSVPGLTLRGCRLEHAHSSPIFAPGITAEWIDLSSSSVEYGGTGTAVFMPAAKVSGGLELTDMEIYSPHARALFAQGVEIGGDIVMQGRFRAVGSDPRALVDFAGAQVNVDVGCSSSHIENRNGPCFHARGMRVKGRLFLDRGFTAIAKTDSENVALNLSGIQVDNWFCLEDTRIENPGGAALGMSHARIGGSIKIGPLVEVTGGGSLATFDLDRCHVAGNVEFDDVSLLSTEGACLSLLRATIGASLSFFGEVQMRNTSTDDPLVRLDGITVGGNVQFERSTFGASRSVAISAANARIGNDFSLGSGVSVFCSTTDDAVTLMRAELHGDLNLRGVEIVNRNGGALAASDLTAVNLRIEDRASVTASSKKSAVRLYGARIKADVHLGDALIRNDRGPALSCFNMQAGDSVYIDQDFRAEAKTERDSCAVNFGNFRVAGDLTVLVRGIANGEAAKGRVNLDGMTYASVPKGLHVQEMLRLIREGSSVYAAQPYQQLAAVYRAAGHDRDVRTILMAQRRDQASGDTLSGGAQRAWVKLSGVVLGYGYQPWRALVWLVCVMVVAVSTALVLGSEGALVRPEQAGEPAGPCTVVEQVGVGLAMGLPLVKSSQPSACKAAATDWGQTLIAVGWPLQIAAWAFATLFVVGFTGAVRRNV